jgi:hypothetical protein
MDVSFGLRSACGDSGAEGGEERIANRSRTQRPPPSRRLKPAAHAARCKRGVALSSTIFKLVAGKRLLYRPLTGTTEVASVDIARASEGDVTPAGETFCEILCKISGEATAPKPKSARS